MPTNILAIPLVSLIAETSNNEDWIDSLRYLVDEEGIETEELDQLDLRGISFEMETRRYAEDHEVVLRASTEDGTLSIGLPPNYGYLLINIPRSTMHSMIAGAYVADVVASAEGLYRVVIKMSLTIVEGITKWP
jgi:hypothetical protein